MGPTCIQLDALAPARDPASRGGADVPAATSQPPDVRPKFPKDEGFQSELRRRVDAYFRESGQAERGGWQMYLKTAIVLGWLAASYATLVFVVQTWWQAIPVAVLLAFALAAVGFNIQHDGGHGAYPAISRIVEQTCREFGVRYSVHRTFLAGLASHYRWLRRTTHRVCARGSDAASSESSASPY